MNCDEEKQAENDIERLIKKTTVVKVFDGMNTESSINKDYMSVFQKDRNIGQEDISKLEICWNKKFQDLEQESITEKLNEDFSTNRLDYSFLHDSFILFYYSFNLLRTSKCFSSNNHGDEVQQLYFNNLCGVGLYGMYHHGKKCIDLIKKLKLIESEPEFFEKFSETRNKFIEHNYNPTVIEQSKKRYLLIRSDVSVWSLCGTDSFLDISIHTKSERYCSVYIDYYADYYELEHIISDIIKGF